MRATAARLAPRTHASVLTISHHSVLCPLRKEKCARRGAYTPFPFMNGVLELLSAPLVRYVANSPEVRGFVDRAEAAVAARKAAGWGMSLKKGQRGPRVWRQNEDVALGFWVSRAERKVREHQHSTMTMTFTPHALHLTPPLAPPPPLSG